MARTSLRVALCVLATLCVTGETPVAAQYKSVHFPKDIGVAGFEFPAPEATINQWIKADDTASIAAHAWGLWIGLNQDSGQVFGNQKLRVFETWNEKEEVLKAKGLAIDAPQRTPFTPKVLRQVRFNKGKKDFVEPPAATQPLGFVRFDPAAVEHILKAKLNSVDTLNSLIKPGVIAEVAPFPKRAISLKVKTTPLKEDANNLGFARFNVWSGPPMTPRDFDQSQWDSSIWIDLNPANASTGDGSVAHGNAVRKPGNTYSINDFVYFKDNTGVLSVVEGMHVATKEVSIWTWQSYWWTPDAANPPVPSSKQIAATRPKQLLAMGAPAHYAVALTYSMRTSQGDNIFGYNPYLETDLKNLSGQFKFAVQSNCLSCHINAAWKGRDDDYVGNELVNIADDKFKGHVRLDFLYSLQPETMP